MAAPWHPSVDQRTRGIDHPVGRVLEREPETIRLAQGADEILKTLAHVLSANDF